MCRVELFGQGTRTWFEHNFSAPTEVQRRGWASIAAGHHTLMLAPTGSGKTLAAFLWCIDRLAREANRRPGTRVVYVSPIKALAYDIEHNLRAPLDQLQASGAAGAITVDVRTGDTTAKERARQRAQPGQILITTPESLYLVLAGQSRDRLRTVDTIIVDEIHALAPNKRGVHLALTLERLSHLVTSVGGADPQRIGLSATQRPLAEIARYLGGDRPVEIVDASAKPALDLQIVVPVVDMENPGDAGVIEHPPARAVTNSVRIGVDGGGLWPLIYPALLDQIFAHRSTIVFCNSRRLAERIAQRLTELAIARGEVAAGTEFVRAHHGSVARHQRLEIEAALKAGRLRAIAATSSLELGIDMGAVDLVVQIESPGSVAVGLQRIGRAGHHVGGVSIGRLFPKFRGDLLESTVVARGMLDGDVESTRVPDCALDVLAQQIVAMVGTEPWSVSVLERVVRRAASYRDLSRQALVSVLDMLSGRYPSDEFAELRPRLTWDRHSDLLIGRKGARLLSVVSGGTIPDRGLYAVHLGHTGPKIGELDEEMVAESRKGETFILGASTWRIDDITRDRVIVTPAPGEPGKMPFWRAEGPGRPIEVGRALGAFCRELDARITADPGAAHTWLEGEYRLDAFATGNLIQYLTDQRVQAGSIPTDRTITIERFRDELGDVRLCVLSPFGSRVHAPWALVVARQLEIALGYPVQPMWTDDGIALRFTEGTAIPTDDQLVPAADDIERILIDELASSSLFASRFRENAARALLLPRRRPGRRTPLWAQRLRAQQLMAVALRFPTFPITLETYREVMRDVFDIDALTAVVRDIHTGAIRIESTHTQTASPFARSLVFDYVAAFLYQGDAPLAERRAHALSLDRNLLRDLIGSAELRELLEPDVINEVEATLQQLTVERHARSLDEIHDMVRRLGDLSEAEIEIRTSRELEDVRAAVGHLVETHRLVPVTIASVRRYVAVEDSARYRDALAIALPEGLPSAFTDLPGRVEGPTESDGICEPQNDALLSLVQRWARTHALFGIDTLAARWGISTQRIEEALQVLETRGLTVRGPLRPGTSTVENCDAEVMRQLRRLSLAKVRAQVTPVSAARYASFLVHWHGLDHVSSVAVIPGGRNESPGNSKGHSTGEAPARGPAGLREAIARIEGIALPFSELETRILPARVIDYHPRMLDELGAAGEIAWFGAGSLGARDGRIILARRDRARHLAPAPAAIAHRTPLHDRIEHQLRTFGAQFLVAIESTAQAPRGDVVSALWDLVWAGSVTNDTFGSLRSLKAAKARRAAPHATLGGRWSLVESLGTESTDTLRVHARATGLLSRWGIVSRDTARAEDVPGGFSAVGDVLRAMEDAGAVRRGLFVTGLEGAQYALPAAVDRLRGHRGDRVVVLAAVDPANAWGSALSWPVLSDRDAKPARRVGASVVTVDGALALWVENRRIATGVLPAEVIERALREGLPALAAVQRRRELAIEVIDGEPSALSPWRAVLERCGARISHRGLLVRNG